MQKKSPMKRAGSPTDAKQSQGKGGQKVAPLTEENLKQLKKSTQPVKIPGTTPAIAQQRSTVQVIARPEAETRKPSAATDGGFALVTRSRRSVRKD